MPQIDNPIDGRGAAQEAQHTPGPWSQYRDHPLVIVDDKGASLGEMLPGDPYISYEAALANARLVAAAPELLAALKHRIDQAEGALRYFEDHYPQDDFLRDTLLHGIEDARAAIARAEGR